MITYIAYRIYKKKKERYDSLSIFSLSICADIILIVVFSYLLGLWGGYYSECLLIY
jgi:hypothetical protein